MGAILQQEGTTRSQQSSVSAALAGSNAAARAGSSAAPMGSANSIAEMAQRDLDTALQLLADRAQYITGANGAAIALRREGKKDMLCRASTGSNVPGLGALLSTEFGLSGESVRTRQAMRCDDAARDARVNHEVCREMGIASVVVMPVVNDDEVLGVFELFSGKVNAFGERDVSALQRLSGLVETAVRLARASERASAGLKDEAAAVDSTHVQGSAVEPVPVDVHAPADVGEIAAEVVPAAEAPGDIAETSSVMPAAGDAGGSAHATQIPVTQEIAAAQAFAVEQRIPATRQAPPAPEAQAIEAVPALPAVEPKKRLFWSAALDASAAHSVKMDQSQVPPMLRNLHKCQACGFPVSSERTLCVECEEKKWRGQLRAPKPVAATAAYPERSASAAAAPAPAKVADTPTLEQKSAEPALAVSAQPSEEKPVRTAAVTLSDLVSTQHTSQDSAPTFSGGLAPSESWLSANKYIVGAVLVVAVVVVAILFLR